MDRTRRATWVLLDNDWEFFAAQSPAVTIVQQLSTPVQQATGSPVVVVAAWQQSPSPTQSLGVAAVSAAVVSQASPVPSQLLVGSSLVVAATTQQSPTPTQALAAAAVVSAVVSQVATSPSQGGSGSPIATGAAATTVVGPTQAAIASAGYSQITQNCPSPVQQVAGTVLGIAVVSQIYTGLLQQATGTAVINAGGSQVVVGPTQQVVGSPVAAGLIASASSPGEQQIGATTIGGGQVACLLSGLSQSLLSSPQLLVAITSVSPSPRQAAVAAVLVRDHIDQVLPLLRQSLTGSAITVLGKPQVPTAPCGELRCGPGCEWIFSRVEVTPRIRGGSRIEWTLHPQFRDPGPYTYRVQAGRTGNPYASDWETVSDLQVIDTYMLDGKLPRSHYRVLLTTAEGVTYASRPQHTLGSFDNKRDWLRAREIKRREQLRLQAKAGEEGYLLKRRHYGEPCSCLDRLTAEVRDSECTICYGTGIVGGYYPAYPCFYAELGLNRVRAHLDETRGSVDDLPRVRGRMLNDPQVYSYDVFVSKDTDIRWFIHQISSKVEIRGVSLVIDTELRQIPFSHVIYQFPLQSS